MVASPKSEILGGGRHIRLEAPGVRSDLVRNGEFVMKKASRITGKGQITVPHEIRRSLGVLPGDKLLFERDGVSVRIRPIRTKSPFEKYRGTGSIGIAPGKKAVVGWVRKLRGR